MYMGTGVGFAGTISVALLFLIKVLFVLFIIGLVAGIAVAIKNYLFTEEDVQKAKNAFLGKKTAKAKEKCPLCDKEVECGWKICPYCGQELTCSCCGENVKEVENV
ncbi:MAG: hypothetical protein N3B21_09725 [Clostridia bacterium]|nr:hypothetical protein [Clostridia bacterium]